MAKFPNGNVILIAFAPIMDGIRKLTPETLAFVLWKEHF